MSINLIGLSAKAESGKDTISKMKTKEGWVRYAFADPLKRFCIEYLGLSHEDVYTEVGKSRFNNEWGMTNREILQKVGSDALRDGFHKQVWIKIAEREIKKLIDNRNKVVITDVRFDNEAELIKKLNGIVVHIERSNFNSSLSESEKQHQSEQGISKQFISFNLFNDSTKEKLLLDFNREINLFSRSPII